MGKKVQKRRVCQKDPICGVGMLKTPDPCGSAITKAPGLAVVEDDMQAKRRISNR